MRQDQATEVLFRAWREGSEEARDQLVERFHPVLAEIAAACLRRDRSCSLSTGDLINQAVLRLMRTESLAVADRAHFVALASRLMRNILIDHARVKAADKRRHVRVELCTAIDGDQRIDLEALDAALVRLRALDVQLMELVEMRYFGGMTTADVAEVLGLSEPTIKRRWQVARAWLMDALSRSVSYG